MDSTRAAHGLREGALVGLGTGTAGGLLSAAGHIALKRELVSNPDGVLGSRFWQLRSGAVQRATLGASIMFAAGGTTVGTMNALGVGLLGDSTVAAWGQSAIAGAAMSGALTWVHPIFHGRQLGTPRSMLVNMTLGTVVGSAAHAFSRQN